MIYDGYEIKQYENARIEVIKIVRNNPQLKRFLRKLALSFNVTLRNSAGNSKNTQQLEDHVIKVIKNSQVS